MSDQERQERSFVVGDDDAGARLDRFLADSNPSISRARIQQALAEGLVTVGGRCRPKSYRVEARDEIRFTPVVTESMRAEAQDIPLDIVFEDDHILVIDKPAGLVVHPAPGHPDGTLVNALLHHCERLARGGGALRPGIVHRLDQHTSGLLVVALSDQAHAGLAAQLKTHEMGRIYLALSWGRWPEAAGEIEGDIGRNPRDRLKMAVVERGGRSALTRYKVTDDFGFVQLCRVALRTGRTHQIRVHFQHGGHPVVGDPVYGDDRRARNVRPVDRAAAGRMVKAAGRQMLHAAELRLVHPVSGEQLVFTAEPPADFAGLVAAMRRGRQGGANPL